uniref:Uncharacterized protein n=1 Tax=Anguilla anguilla TaxID=7936 RepID=A0A0E9WC62_ANGAN
MQGQSTVAIGGHSTACTNNAMLTSLTVQ